MKCLKLEVILLFLVYLFLLGAFLHGQSHIDLNKQTLTDIKLLLNDQLFLCNRLKTNLENKEKQIQILQNTLTEVERQLEKSKLLQEETSKQLRELSSTIEEYTNSLKLEVKKNKRKDIVIKTVIPVTFICGIGIGVGVAVLIYNIGNYKR